MTFINASLPLSGNDAGDLPRGVVLTVENEATYELAVRGAPFKGTPTSRNKEGEAID